jgi:hypothetical protein
MTDDEDVLFAMLIFVFAIIAAVLIFAMMTCSVEKKRMHCIEQGASPKECLEAFP